MVWFDVFDASEIAARMLHAADKSKMAISECAQEHPLFRAGVLDEMERMQHEMNRLAQRRLGQNNAPVRTESIRMPRCQLQETEKAVIASFELPGAEKKDIELNVTDTHIEVKVQKKMEKEHQENGAYYYQAASQGYYRAVPLPVEVQGSKAEASYRDGVLRVEVPKLKQVERRAKRIEIK
ncbi:MAG TPA: Hsp20/alpha crystallin family protein [Candidatus Nanoarchaeia archaeon]|nr:Hsp20/alpha crystallin family protein [Candidatus Nanoarchaeia archaeon]